jgi:tRNA-splicing ligase RtcB
MKLSVLDVPPAHLATRQGRLIKALEQETRFGVGSSFRTRRSHEVMDEGWSEVPLLAGLKDLAWSQLGTSGSGNHFVEYGLLTLERPELGLEPGTYVALLSHSGSRGAGARIAQHYSRLAADLNPGLPRDLQRLAWLGLDTGPGQEYWLAMQLMGRYAAANHDLIHRHVVARLGAEVLADVENHHNFAWKERHRGEDVIVHRKGATPAGAGALGVIPGSMADPAFVVRGRGLPASLDSAAHGAGRRMSRRAAKDRFTAADLRRVLERHHVTLLSAGLDEVPMAYKSILDVMAAQADLVEPVARFEPRLVKMAPAGERPED